jgi:hypothetical protein
MVKMSDRGEFCGSCGVPHGAAIDERLWALHYRRADGRQYGEPLVFFGDDLDGFDDAEERHDVLTHAMGKNMVERGLCPACGRPALAGLAADDFLSEDDARAAADMHAERLAEIRAGA